MTINQRSATLYRAVYQTSWSKRDFERGARSTADLYAPTATTPEQAVEVLYTHTEGTCSAPLRIERMFTITIETAWEEVLR